MMAKIGGIPPSSEDIRLRLETNKLNNLKCKNERLQKNKEEDRELRKAANEFEAIFFEQLMKAMRRTVEKTGLISGGRAEEIFQGMLDEKYSEMMAQKDTLGISDLIYNELKRENDKEGK
jgi:flagellar protein FlgJ